LFFLKGFFAPPPAWCPAQKYWGGGGGGWGGVGAGGVGVGCSEERGGGGGQGMGSKAFAPTWYRALTWYSVPWSPPRTHFEPWKAVGTWGRGSLAAW